MAPLLAAALACADPAGPSASTGLVFVRPIDGSMEIVRARISDASEQRVTHTPRREERWPFWSGASSRLLFQARVSGEPDDLFLWNPENGRETPLVRTPDRDEGWQRWSPDGERVVYAFRGGVPAAGVAWVQIADGVVTPLARSGRRDFFLRPHFAPDGTRVVAQRRGEDGRGSGLWLLSAGSEPRPLLSDSDWFYSKGRFTRDGSRILFSRRRLDSAFHEIGSIASEGDDLRQLVAGQGQDAHSAWASPTRDEIAFVASSGGDYDLYLLDTDGGVRPLTRTPGRNELAPHWSPDGELLVVTTTPSGSPLPRLDDPERLVETGIAVIDRSGAEHFAALGFMPDWMPPWP